MSVEDDDQDGGRGLQRDHVLARGQAPGREHQLVDYHVGKGRRQRPVLVQYRQAEARQEEREHGE